MTTPYKESNSGMAYEYIAAIALDAINKPPSYSTYLGLYSALQDQISRNWFWNLALRYWNMTYGLLLFISLLVTIFGEGLSSQSFFGLWNMGFGYLIVYAFMAAVHAAWINARNVDRLSSTTAVYLLLQAISPHRKHHGLTGEDIITLETVAKNDRGSADWRGGIVNNLIIAIVLAAVIAFQSQISVDFFDGLYNRLRIGEDNSLGVSLFISTILLGFFYIVYSLLRYFHQYVANEIGNRVIIHACHEINILLEKNKLQKTTLLSWKERQDLIAQLGYKLVQNRESVLFHYFRWKNGHIVGDDDGNAWEIATIALTPITRMMLSTFRMMVIWIIVLALGMILAIFELPRLGITKLGRLQTEGISQIGLIDFARRWFTRFSKLLQEIIPRKENKK